jgi:hypothetical protein
MRQTLTTDNFVQEVLHYPQGKGQPPTEVVEALRGLAAGNITIDIIKGGPEKSLVVHLASGEIIIYRLSSNMVYTTSRAVQSPESIILFISRLWLEQRPEFMKPFLAFLGAFAQDAQSSATAQALAELSQVLLPIVENELAPVTNNSNVDFVSWFSSVNPLRDAPILPELTAEPESTLSIAVDSLGFLKLGLSRLGL